ncbi:MAG: hypothetical protein ACLVAH_01465 [Anaeromassilibacillus sp.]
MSQVANRRCVRESVSLRDRTKTQRLCNIAGPERSQTLHSYNRLSTKSVLNNEKVNYIRLNPVTNSKEFRRQYPRRERRCASTGPEHGCLHDPAWSKCGEALHGDRWLNAE